MVTDTASTPATTAPTPQRALLEGWGRTPRSVAEVYAVGSEQDLAAAMKGAQCSAAEDSRPAAMLARGLGRSYGDASLNAGGSVLDLTAMDRVRAVDIESAMVTVDAGVSFDALIRALLPLGLFVPVTAGTRYITIGGAIASDVHGKNHHVDGSLQRHLVSFELVTPDGRTRTVSAESDSGVFSATAGGMGLTGVVKRATLRLLPVETAFMRVDTERVPNLDVALDRMLSTDDRYRYSVAWTDCLARGRNMGRSVLMRGDHALREELPSKYRDAARRLRTGPGATVPPWAPGGMLTPLTVAAFNEAYFRRAPVERRGHIESIATFFHPLDGLLHWNRAYGRRGFVQYQFVVPYGEEDTIRVVLDTLSSQRVPTFVPVLKRFGPGCGMLSFPISGWTMTFDIPAGFAGLSAMLDGFDRLVANAGGRVYLAKDARLQPGIFREMYPELARWQAVRATLDPGRVLQSDLGRRLELI